MDDVKTKEQFKLKLGLNDCTNAQYHSDKAWISSTSLKLLLQNPADFYNKHILGTYFDSIPEQVAVEGTLAHTLILEPNKFDEEFILFDEFRKAGKVYEEFKLQNPGKYIVSKPQLMKVKRWVEAYKQLPEATSLLESGIAEQSLCINIMGVPVKVRADWLNPDVGYIADVKTSSMPTDVDSFKHVVERYSYDLSAALYMLAFEEYYKRPFKDFYFIVLGKKDNSCQVFRLSDKTREQGTNRVYEALRTYKKCLESGVWTTAAESVKIEEKIKAYEILEV